MQNQELLKSIVREELRRIWDNLSVDAPVDIIWKDAFAALSALLSSSRLMVEIDSAFGRLVLPENWHPLRRRSTVLADEQPSMHLPRTLDLPLCVRGARHATLRASMPEYSVRPPGLDPAVKVDLEYALAAYLLHLRQRRRVRLIQADADCLPYARYVVEDELRVCYTNRIGATLCEAGEILAIDDGYLGAVRHREHVALLEAVESCRRQPESVVNLMIGAFKGGWPCSVRVRCLRSSECPFVDSAPWYEIIVLVPSQHPIEIDALLLHGKALTPAERRVLSEVLNGLSAAEIAERLGITPGTAKLHIIRTMKKLGVNRQTRLLRDVLGSFVCRLPGLDGVTSHVADRRVLGANEGGPIATGDAGVTNATCIPIGIHDQSYTQN